MAAWPDTRAWSDGALPSGPLELDLPGETVTLLPDAPDALFARTFADTETLLAVHRFAWVPLLGGRIDPVWVDVLWRCWLRRHAEPDDSWIWHPYTAAERAINILDFARRYGLPGERDATMAMLARHIPAIVSRLEYFGEHDTGNHLSNNGRGLYRLGTDLGISQAADIGGRILLREAERIFRPSGVLREGSTHYHLLLTRNYLDAWLAARRHGRPEAPAFEALCRRLLAVAQHFDFAGGMPLVGDISPDCPPPFLYGLLPSGDLASGWTGLRAADEQAALTAIKRDVASHPVPALADDGWIDFAHGAWRSLWHVAPEGWPPMPGHAHQDMGSGEIHFDCIPLIVDPGRGAYGETGEAAYYVSSAAHNSMRIDGNDPYPPNKPYYDPSFRRSVCGVAPQVVRAADRIMIVHDGFTRLKGIGRASREIKFDKDSLVIVDRIAGTRTATVSRRLHSPWPCEDDNGAVILKTPVGRFRVHADAKLSCSPVKRWIAYGKSDPAWMIEAVMRSHLPGELTMGIERL